ncbi:MAG: hypothetical protein JXQ93_02250 [Flavobacteriaceae bacterium]
MKNTLLPLFLLLLFSSCGSTSVVKSQGASVAPGTNVPFRKVANESFAENYIDADILVDCRFFSSQAATASYTTKKLPKNHFAFQVISTDANPNADQLSSSLTSLIVLVPTEYSDMIFSLKKGDKIQLRGGTYVTKAKYGSFFGLNQRYVHFKATSIQKQ